MALLEAAINKIINLTSKVKSFGLLGAVAKNTIILQAKSQGVNLLAKFGQGFKEFTGLWVVDKDAVQVVDKNDKKIYVAS